MTFLRSRIATPLALIALAALVACGDDAQDTGGAATGAHSDHDKDAAGAKATAGKGASKPTIPGGGGGDAMLVKIRFEARVGSEPFACGRSYANVGTPPREVSPVDFRFYVYGVRLLSASGQATEVALLQDGAWQYQSVAMLDFENHEGACDQGDAPMHTEVEGAVPAGDYTGVEFAIGIPPELNHADLSTQPSPLNKSSLFWSWNAGHIFFAATARATGVAGGAADADAGAALDGDLDAGVDTFIDHLTHLGATGCDGNPVGGVPVTMCSHENRPVYRFEQFDLTKQRIVADFGAVKRGSDVAASEGCHSFTPETCTAPFKQLGIDFASGELTPKTQTVFHVE